MSKPGGEVQEKDNNGRTQSQKVPHFPLGKTGGIINHYSVYYEVKHDWVLKRCSV